MVLQEIICDKCGDTIMADRTLLKAETGPMRKHRESTDLCVVCAEAFSHWLADGMESGRDRAIRKPR